MEDCTSTTGKKHNPDKKITKSDTKTLPKSPDISRTSMIYIILETKVNAKSHTHACRIFEKSWVGCCLEGNALSVGCLVCLYPHIWQLYGSALGMLLLLLFLSKKTRMSRLRDGSSPSSSLSTNTNIISSGVVYTVTRPINCLFDMKTKQKKEYKRRQRRRRRRNFYAVILYCRLFLSFKYIYFQRCTLCVVCTAATWDRAPSTRVKAYTHNSLLPAEQYIYKNQICRAGESRESLSGLDSIAIEIQYTVKCSLKRLIELISPIFFCS